MSQETIQKGTELSMQVKQLTVRHDELASRLAEAKEQLLLLGDVDRDDENKGMQACRVNKRHVAERGHREERGLLIVVPRMPRLVQPLRRLCACVQCSCARRWRAWWNGLRRR